MRTKHIYTGRLWVLPSSREYELRIDGRRCFGGKIAAPAITTEALEKLEPGAIYSIEVDENPYFHWSCRPSLIEVLS
jgi:hypothetical protein